MAAKECGPERPIFGRPDVNPEDWALPLASDADGDYRRLAGHAAIHAHLVIRGIHPDVRVVGRERPGPERLHVGLDGVSKSEVSRICGELDPRAFISSSTFRVDTPWTYASCTTASSACSARRRGCSSEGK